MCKLDKGGGRSWPRDIISSSRTVATKTALLSDVDVELHWDFKVAAKARSKTEQ